MTGRAGLEVDTLTIRIPIRLQRRGGRKLIVMPEGVTAPARKPSRDETLVKALVRAHGWRRRIESGRRSRSPTLRSKRASRSPMFAGCSRSHAWRRTLWKRSWTGDSRGAAGCRGAGEWTACLERPEGDVGLQQLTLTCSESCSTAVIQCRGFDSLGVSASEPPHARSWAAEVALKLKQTAGKRKSEPACPVCARKQPWLAGAGGRRMQPKPELARFLSIRIGLQADQPWAAYPNADARHTTIARLGLGRRHSSARTEPLTRLVRTIGTRWVERY